MGLFDANDILSTGKKILGDTLSNLGVPKDEDGPAGVTRQTIYDDDSRVASKKIDQQEHDKLFVASDPILQHITSPGVTTTIDEGILDDSQMSYYKTKELNHDLAHESSAEQGVLDFFARKKARLSDSTTLTPEEALKLGRDFGVDLKYDKNVTKGEALFTINKNLYKRDLERQLATYATEHDFSTLQNIGLAGSAISGGMGAVELAATIGISFLLPEVGLAAIARLGRIGAISEDAMQGINLAYRTQKAMKVAQRYRNAATLLLKAGSEAEAASALSLFARSEAGLARATSVIDKNKKIIDSASKTTKFWYDITNEARMGSMLSTKGAVAPKAALFAADFAASNVPSMVVSGYNSEMNQNNTYSLIDVAVETLLATTLGIATPTILKAFGAGFKCSVDLVRGVSDKLNEMRASSSVEAALTGYAKNADTIDKGASKLEKELSSIANNLKQTPAKIMKDAEYLSKINMTDEEFMMNMTYVFKSILNGKVPNLALLPNKNAVLSTVSRDILDSIDELESSVVRTEVTNGKLTSVSLGDEGLLGRAPVSATSESDAVALLKDIYKANMHGDTEAYVRASDYISRQELSYNRLEDLIYRVNQQKYNKSAEQIDIKTELRDIIGTMLYGDSYKALGDEVASIELDNILSGSKVELPAHLKTMDDSINEIMDSLLKEKILTDGSTVYNLKGKNALSLVDELKSASAINKELLDSDEFLLSKYGTPEELLDAIQKGDALVDKDTSTIFSAPKASHEDMLAKREDLTYWDSKLQEAQLSLQNTQESTESYQSFLKAVSGLTEKDKADFTTHSKYFTDVERKATETSKVRAEVLPTLRENLVNKITTDEKLQASLSKYMSDTNARAGQKTRLLSSDSPLRKIIKEEVITPLEEKGYIVKGRVADNLVSNFVKKMESGTNFSNSATIVSKLESSVTTDMAEQGAKEVVGKANYIAEITNVLDPFFTEIEKDLVNTQYNATRSLGIMIDTFDRMSTSGYAPSEVLISLATMTPYNIKGSAINVENITNNANTFIQDIRNQLALKNPGTTSTDKMLTTGVDLNQYMDIADNKEGIDFALLTIRHYGSAEEAKKAGIALNDNDAIIAKVILDKHAELLSQLHQVGSKVTQPGSNLHPAKLANAQNIIPDSEISDIVNHGNSLSELGSRLSAMAETEESSATTKVKYGQAMLSKPAATAKKGEYYTRLGDAFNRLLNPEGKGSRRLALYAFKNFDLDSMFNSRGAFSYSLNKIRDDILTGNVMSAMEEDLYNFNKAVRSMEHIADSLVGKQEDAARGVVGNGGFVRSVDIGSRNVTALEKGTHTKFVEDLENRIQFKNLEAEHEAGKLFGYDTVKDQLEHDFNTLQRAYATLKVFGPEPVQLVDTLMSAWNNHLVQDAKKFPTKKEIIRNTLTTNQMRSIKNNVKLACGLDNVAASASSRIVNVLKDFLSAPLLTSAGFKAFTDYAYSHQYLITNGLADSPFLLQYTKGIKSAVELAKDPELRKLILYTNSISQDGLTRMLLNNDGVSIGRLSDAAPFLDKAEQFTQKWANFMINNIGLVEKTTNVNRSAGAFTLMRGVAAYSNKSYAELNERLQGLLTRHGVSDRDWDFLRSHGVIEADEYVSRFVDNPKKQDRGFELFIPSLIGDVSDEDILKEMSARGFGKITTSLVEEFRRNLSEKANVIINTGANEMVTLPTGRTRSAMTLGFNKNTGIGTALGALTQYQSFSLAATQLHFGRRLAQYVDPNSVSFLTILDVLQGKAGFNPHMDTAGLLLSLAGAQFVIDEFVDWTKGNQQGFIDSEGNLNYKKITDPLISATGIFGGMIDGMMNVFESGGTRGGGIAIPAAPFLSSSFKDLKNIHRAITSESNQDNKVGAVAAAGVQNAARMTGVSTSPFLTYFWNQAIGSWLDEQARGAQAYNKYIRNRRRQGYEINDYQEHPLPFWEQTE